MDHVARTPQQLSSILKNWRAQRHLTQQDAAALVGIKQSTVSELEADASGARLDTLYKLMAALGLELVIRDRGSAPSRVASKREW